MTPAIRSMLLAAGAIGATVASAGPVAAQYSPYGGIGGALNNILGGMAYQQQQAAREQDRAARAYQYQQMQAAREAQMAQAQADVAARQAEYNRKQAIIRQANVARAQRDAADREQARQASMEAAAAQAEQDRLAREDKRQVLAAQAEQDRLAREDDRRVAAAAARDEAAEQERSRLLMLAAQKAAEDSPDNHCKDPKFARVVMENFNKFKVLHRLDTQVIDIEHITTDKYDAATTAMVCHGTFLLDNSVEVPGSFEIRKNVAGDLINLWTPDASDGGASHTNALKTGPVRDIQMVTGATTADGKRSVVVISAKTEKSE